MSSLGPYLRELRERRGISLDEISRTTRVGRPYLEALEAGDFARLPSPVFTRGFVLAYCQALGVPADEALAHYGARPAPPEDPAPGTKPATALRRDRDEGGGRSSVLVSFVLVVILGVALFALAFVLQSGRDVGEQRAEPTAPPAVGESARADQTGAASAGSDVLQRSVSGPTGALPGTPPAVTEVVRPAPLPAPPPVPAQAVVGPDARSQPAHRSPSPVPAPTASIPPSVGARPASPAPLPTGAVTQQDVAAAIGAVSAPYRLVARTTATTWVRVRTEDGRQNDETVPPGQTREWVSNRPFTVSIGNAGGISLELNGRALPPLGPSGTAIGRLVLPGETP